VRLTSSNSLFPHISGKPRKENDFVLGVTTCVLREYVCIWVRLSRRDVSIGAWTSLQIPFSAPEHLGPRNSLHETFSKSLAVRAGIAGCRLGSVSLAGREEMSPVLYLYPHVDHQTEIYGGDR